MQLKTVIIIILFNKCNKLFNKLGDYFKIIINITYVIKVGIIPYTFK